MAHKIPTIVDDDPQSLAYRTPAEVGIDPADQSARIGALETQVAALQSTVSQNALTSTMNKDAVADLDARVSVLEGVQPPPPPPPPPVGRAKPVFGTENAPWAIPAVEISTHPNNQAILQELFDVCPGRININTDNWAPAVYDVADATTVTTLNIGQPGWGNLANSDQVPWNPAWELPTDGDAYVLVVDFTNGENWVFWQTTNYNAGSSVLTMTSARKIKVGTQLGHPTDANVLIKDNGFEQARGCGIQHAAMMVMREEIEAGLIPHCMSWGYPKPTLNAFVAPALKGIGNPSNAGGAGRGAMGYRVVWDGLTEADINNWLSSLPVEIRTVMRVIAECARDYGFMTSDNAGNESLKRGATHFENTRSGKWFELGLTNSNTLFALHTLLEPTMLGKARVLAEPTYPGGDSENAACYATAGYPGGHACFTGTTPPPPPPPGNTLLHDDFSTVSVEDAFSPPQGMTWLAGWEGWGVRHLAGNNDQGGKGYVPGVTHVATADGMEIRCDNIPAFGFPYAAGMISTERSQAFVPPIRIDIEQRFRNLTAGMHWSWWMLRHASGGSGWTWPPETDILECVGSNLFAPNGPVPIFAMNMINQSAPFFWVDTTVSEMEDWHKISLEWHSNVTKWFLNDIQVRELPTLYTDPMYFLGTWEVGASPNGDFPGPVNGSTVWPGAVEVRDITITDLS